MFRFPVKAVPLILFTPTGNTALNSVFTPLSSGREGLHRTNYNEGYFVPLFLGKGIHAQRLLGYSRKYYSLDKMKAGSRKMRFFGFFWGDAYSECRQDGREVDVKKKEKVAKNDVERRRYKCFLCERYALLIHFIKCFKD